MAKVLLTYYSRTGNTEKMAEIIAETIKTNNHEVILKKITETDPAEMLDADGIIIGSPTYYGQMAAEVKFFIDKSVKHHSKLDGKVGGAFTSSGGRGGGNETTITGILMSLLVHGMIIQGYPGGDHYGPVAVKNPDERSVKECQRFGERFSALLDRLK
ncbi:MAG: NAD(P)H-dependent oxidoreductase [Deltaproteobacteria bacterium]|nr:NAD(P)H-dependent oxidoreductase [Deltaproteobacteria bacterium]MBW2051911.1 NAD(P)H-dependent oxidoreductase [Deltaproteobacteria bacterium]MBW2140971.1 NAD(P)H-dependent oxidoreductase [Deltaproteobacteria bacterium]MBW2322721.1 NAD(P)H-dependent oxidoreductase [Deltaproteobacteria bacterium]